MKVPYCDLKGLSETEKFESESSLYGVDDIDDEQTIQVQLDQKETSHFLNKDPELKIKTRKPTEFKDIEIQRIKLLTETMGRRLELLEVSSDRQHNLSPHTFNKNSLLSKD